MQRVVVGVDGSAAAEVALRWSGRLAAASAAELVVVHAFRNPHAEVSPEQHELLLAERASLVADRWVRVAVEAGGSVRTVVEAGDPRTVVLAVAEAEDADLVVLGRTGRGGGPGFLHLGSVVEHAVHHTGWPLTVIPSEVFGPIRRIVIGVDGSLASSAAVDCAPVSPARWALR